jgi:hypothetical protein
MEPLALISTVSKSCYVLSKFKNDHAAEQLKLPLGADKHFPRSGK